MLKSELGLDAELRPGPSGQFLVQVDGETVAQKTLRGFPAESEIIAAVRARLAA